ncbi:pseudouridine synthase [Buchnera aphidicola]|uniref:pseudouridine synthase n=1 Tax=Buchnera aphidicola TaxID=9 RepID=UPI0031B8186B
MYEKIQKILARLGYGSRRTLETMIQANCIYVNGYQVKIGQRYCIHEIKVIQINNKIVTLTKLKPCLLMYNKPKGLICTRKDPKERNTVFNMIPELKKSRWIIVGRLDYNSCGLLLFTNDGELAYRLMHPKFKIIREYLVNTFGTINLKKINKLKSGIYLQDGYAKFQNIQWNESVMQNNWIKVSLTEGRNREVRRMCEKVGLRVNKLIRIRYGNIMLPNNMRSGSFIYLKSNVIRTLYKLVNLKYMSIN